VFARKGYFGSRVADIAQEAGIAYGLIYHYFRNKEGLLLAIFHETWNLLLERIRTVQSQPVDAGSKLRQIARFLLEGFRSNPDLFEVLVVEVIRSSKLWETDTLSRIGEAFRLLEQMVEEGKRAGDFGPELDSRLACSIFYGALDQIITDWVVGLRPSGDQDVERAIGMVETVILGGMGMGAPAKGRAS
jgi:AcrR family transcriptional regulator